MDNRKQLKQLMDEYGLTYAEVAKMLDTSIRTVGAWLRPADASDHRNMPDRMIEFLKLKLENR